MIGAAVFLWIVSIAGAVLGVAELAMTVQSAESAPQQAAGAAMAAAYAVIPYCLARAVDSILALDRQKRRMSGDSVTGIEP